MNAFYHLELLLYDKLQIYSFRNDPIQAKAVTFSRLANAGFKTSYDDIMLCGQVITVNTSINEQNVKILLLFEIGFNSYEILLRDMVSTIRRSDGL